SRSTTSSRRSAPGCSSGSTWSRGPRRGGCASARRPERPSRPSARGAPWGRPQGAPRRLAGWAVAVSRWQVAFLRAALLWLVATGALGLWVTLSPGLSALVRPTHAHMGTIGFFLGMVMGVAFWMLPRPGGIRQTGLEAATFLLLQAGLVLRVEIGRASCRERV